MFFVCIARFLLECLFLKRESSLASMALFPVDIGSLSGGLNTSFMPALKEGGVLLYLSIYLIISSHKKLYMEEVTV